MRTVATTPGLYPLPDDAKERLSDLKGHQKHDLVSGDEGEEVRAVYRDARERVVETQREAGLDRVVEGQLRWDDMLAHPLCVHDGVRTEGIVRYYDNNNFYREPVVEGELTYDGDVAAELEAASEATDDLQAVLPGPHSLADLATDEHYGDEAEFLAAVGEFLAREVEAFPEVETLFLLDPSLVTNPPAEDRYEAVVEAVDGVVGAADCEVVLHTYWGAFDEKTHAHVLDSDVDALGYDLVSAPEESVELIAEYGSADDVALGLVDGQNTLVESPSTIRERVEWFEDRLPSAVDFDTAYLTSNTELFYLPVNRFKEKLRALGAATTEVEA
ncbi:MAG: 5-methyltetrahydropteroyltriglutamate--homocysteine methyltransferase [Halobacteriaceae archaeon]